MLSQTVMTVSLCVAALIFGAFANRADSQGKAKVLLTKPTKKKVLPSSFKLNLTTVEPVHHSLVPSASTLVLPSLSLEDIPVNVPATKSARLLKLEASAKSSLAEVQTHKMKEMDAVESTGMSELEVNKGSTGDASAAAPEDDSEREAAPEGEAPPGDAQAPAPEDAPQSAEAEEGEALTDADAHVEAAKQEAFGVAGALKDRLLRQEMLVLTIDAFASIGTSVGNRATKVSQSETFKKLVVKACTAADKAKTALPANKEEAFAMLKTAKEAVDKAVEFAVAIGGPFAQELKTVGDQVLEAIKTFVSEKTELLKENLQPHADRALDKVTAHPAWTASEPLREGATKAAAGAWTATKPLRIVAANTAGRVQDAAKAGFEASAENWKETQPKAAEGHVTSDAATDQENVADQTAESVAALGTQ